VVATQAFDPREVITTMETAESILYLGSIIPLHDLRGLLSGAPLNEKFDTLPVIIIDAKNGRIALKVSEFIRPQKLVLIPLPEIFSVRGVSGTTILGGNQLGMVLDPFELIALATGRTLDSSEDRGAFGASGLDFSVGGAFEPAPDGLAAAPAEEFHEPGDQAGEAARPAELDENVAEEFFIEIHNILNDLN
jgi:hypothetical protein